MTKEQLSLELNIPLSKIEKNFLEWYYTLRDIVKLLNILKKALNVLNFLII